MSTDTQEFVLQSGGYILSQQRWSGPPSTAKPESGIFGDAGMNRQLGSMPSLLDRLIDDEPNVQQESLNHRAQDLRELKRSVARDLENMLNTQREALKDVPSEFVEVNQSLLVYGLPDFSSFNLLSPGDGDLLCRAIERVISNFEPRLQRPNVRMEAPNQSERVFRFRVDALFRIEPAPEPVVFDTTLQLGTQEYQVKGTD
jgi:type VI secretion system protein ImpF